MQRFMTASDAIRLSTRHLENCCKSLVVLISDIQKRIQFQSTVGHDCERDLLWKCPKLLPELPLYEPMQMCTRLHLHFTQQGFFVRQVNDNSLYISWRKSQLPVSQQQNRLQCKKKKH